MSYEHLDLKDWLIDNNDIDFDEKNIIGKGNFGIVYLANWRSTKVVAKVSHDKILKHKILHKELLILTKLHHPNIVQFLGYSENPFIIVMEYVKGKPLLNYIVKNTLCLNQKIKICQEILLAIQYLHHRKPKYLIHRDLKPHNILVDKHKHIKIIDFGLSRILSYDNLTLLDHKTHIKKQLDLTQPVGSKRYMAPEIRLQQKYDHKVDIWSLGIIFYELFENKRYDTKGFGWFKTPSKVKTIIQQSMLQTNPEHRLNTSHLIEKFKTLNYNMYCIIL